MVTKGAVLLITLFVASASLSLAYTDPTEKLDQCLDRCQSRQQVLSCEGRCAHDYYRQRHDFEQEDEEWLNPSARRMQERCERQCRREPRLQRGQCQMRCEREPHVHVEEEELRMCQQRCQRDERGYQHQMQCLKRCERSTQESPSKWVASFLDFIGIV